MDSYLGYFSLGTHQVLSLVSTFTVWFGLSLIGSVVAGRRAIRVAAPFFGWAIITLIFTLGGVLTALSFTTISIFIGILGLGSFVYLLWAQQTILDHGFIKLVVITIPLWILISGMVASQWDEFSHWLPSTRFLLDHDRFPDSVHSITGASFPAYPYGWPILMYLASRLAGEFVENSGALLNLLALLTFGLVLLEVVRIGLGKPDKEKLKKLDDGGLGRSSRNIVQSYFCPKACADCLFGNFNLRNDCTGRCTSLDDGKRSGK